MIRALLLCLPLAGCATTKPVGMAFICEGEELQAWTIIGEDYYRIVVGYCEGGRQIIGPRKGIAT